MTPDSGSDTHLVQWDIQVQRRWSPLYFLNNERVKEPVPPMWVNVSVEFDDNQAALSFEARVREILEDMT